MTADIKKISSSKSFYKSYIETFQNYIIQFLRCKFFLFISFGQYHALLIYFLLLFFSTFGPTITTTETF